MALMARQTNVLKGIKMGLSIWRKQKCYTSVLASLY
jgi:hypothetical protein